MALPAKRAEVPDLELVKPNHKRATPAEANEVELAARAFTQSEQLALYREGIESLREMAKSGGDTARASAAAKLATIFRDASLSKTGKVQVRILFVDPRELVDEVPAVPTTGAEMESPEDEAVPSDFIV